MIPYILQYNFSVKNCQLKTVYISKWLTKIQEILINIYTRIFWYNTGVCVYACMCTHVHTDHATRDTQDTCIYVIVCMSYIAHAHMCVYTHVIVYVTSTHTHTHINQY